MYLRLKKWFKKEPCALCGHEKHKYMCWKFDEEADTYCPCGSSPAPKYWPVRTLPPHFVPQL